MFVVEKHTSSSPQSISRDNTYSFAIVQKQNQKQNPQKKKAVAVRWKGLLFRMSCAGDGSHS